MATKLSNENITNAKAAISAYKTAVDSAFQALSTEIKSNLSSGYVGEGYNGYSEFFDQITPVLSTQLTDGKDSVVSLLTSVFNAVQQLTNPVDTQIGENNRNANENEQ